MSRDLSDDAKARLLDSYLKSWTEIDGKYSTRYRSRMVLGESEFDIEHDHVWTRRALKLMLTYEADEEFVRAFLSLAVGCVVTKHEHQQLTALDEIQDDRISNGWDRYDEVGITVVDMATLKVMAGPLKGLAYDLEAGDVVMPTVEDIKSGIWPAERDD